MEAANVDGLVNILVKAPDQLVEDQMVKCQLSWTVGMLKDHLEQVYPDKPKRKDQKVIFLGHVLSDTLILKDVLQQNYSQNENETFIVHLVCPFRKKTTPSTSNKPSTAKQNHSTSASVSPTSVNLSPMQQYYGQLNNQQMAWMQQAYAHYAHYLTQYMQMMSANGVQWPGSLPPNLNVDPSNSINLPTNNPSEESNEEQTRQEAETPENPPNNNNAGEEEAGLNRDWLDVFDVFARIVVLCSIVYFYSSLSRFLIVTFLGFSIYLIQGGFFRGQVFLPENNNPRAENNNQPINEPQPNGQRLNSVQPNESETHPEVRTTNINEENERPGAWAFTWTFFSSFFASLIPEQPHVI